MLLHVPLSVGEVLDKVSILEIKSERIGSKAKLKNVNTELTQLRELLTDPIFEQKAVQKLIADGLAFLTMRDPKNDTKSTLDRIHQNAKPVKKIIRSLARITFG